MDNKSKQAFPLTQFFGKGAGRKSDVLDAFASDLTKFSKKESNIKLLESIGFTFSQAQSQSANQEGISISSNSNDTLGATLTNPTELAKSKGKISKSYPITYDNKTYKDVEEAYQALKDASESKRKEFYQSLELH